MPFAKAGTVQVQSTAKYGPLTCTRVACMTDSSGDAVMHFDNGLVNGELRKLVVYHNQAGVSDTISVYLYDRWDNQLLVGGTVSGLSANATTSVLMYEEIGSVQARALLIGGPQVLRIDLSGTASTPITLEFWYIAGIS